MLGRHMFGYAPSLVVAALVSFASVSLFTSVMSQAEFGQYTLAINAMTMLVGVGFFWLQSAASRLMPQAAEQKTDCRLISTLYCVFAVCSVVLMVIAVAIAFSFPLGDWRVAVWFAPPLAILRSLLNLNQAIHRSFVRIVHYNIIEIGQAIIGLAASVALVVLAHMGASGAATGSMLGLAALALFDWRMLTKASWKNFDVATFREVAHFGMPFIVTYGLSFVLSRSDSFLIEHFLGPDQVGIYAAGYAFPDRVGQNLFMAVATASFPLVVRRMEQEGTEAARDQTYTNGVALLALSMPACIGLLLANRHIAAVLIGQDFRAGAVMIMPWIAVATIFNGIAAHYFDHAFHLAKKTWLFFFTLGPAALLNFVGNLYAIPHYGIIGAAYTTLGAYLLYLFLSIIVGRHVFRIRFPMVPAVQIALSTALMAFVLYTIDFPLTAGGLASLMAIGGAVYFMGILAFDVMGLRTMSEKWLGRWSASRGVTSDLSFDILVDEAAVEKIADDWNALFASAGKGVFGGYAWFHIWWRHLGKSAAVQLHVVTARRHGRLVAILPLVVRRSGMLRVLEWAGHDVFDYGDVVAERATDVEALWRYASVAGGYDIALIKDVHVGAASLETFSLAMHLRDQRHNYFLTLDFPSGDAWLAAQSRKLRGDVRRKTEKMQAQGTVSFNVYRSEDLVPLNVIDALYAQKSAWFTEREASGAFSRPEVKNFLHDIAQDAAREGMLYLAWLSCGDVIVACHMGFVRNNVLHLYHTTYDAAFGAFSPGIAMMCETIKWAVDANLHELDFMRGDEAYKQRFASGNRPLSAFVWGCSSLGKLAVRLRQSKANKESAVTIASVEEL